MNRLCGVGWLTVVVAILASATLSSAQETMGDEPRTRAEALRRAREQKARALEPYKPSRLEATMDFLEDKGLLLLTREGLYPKLGSLTTGSGFAAGAGYRSRGIFNRVGTLDLWAAGSLKQYFGMRAEATFPDLAGGRL